MNVKLQLLTVGAVFFLGGQALRGQQTKSDTTASKDIEEVVVLGYSKVTTKPKDVSANTTITAEVLENRPNVSFLNSIQGSAPGVTIASGSGSPGSAKIDVVIRGISSLNASTEPLIVLDGVPTNANQFRNLNPDDIESVSILRDAAATSIYGNRGANGVLIVKTKGAKFNSPLKFNYNNLTGISVLPENRYNLANSSEFLTLQKRLGVPEAVAMTDEQIANTPTTNWNKVFFKPDLVQQHNINASFGGENTSVYTSLGYLNQGGMVPSTNFQRMTLRNNIMGKSKNSRFTYSAQTGLAYSKRNQLLQETNSTVNNNGLQNPLQGALLGDPTVRPKSYATSAELFNYLTENGQVSPNYNNRNFIYVLEDNLNNRAMFHQIQDVNIFTGTTVSYKLSDKWTVSNRSGVDYKVTNGDYGYTPTGFLGMVQAFTARNTTTPNPFGGLEQLYNSRELNFNSVTSTSYDLNFGDNHTLNLGAFVEYTKVHYLYNSQTANGLDPRVWTMGTGRGYVDLLIEPTTAAGQSIVRYQRQVSASKVNAGSLAYFATADYDYDSKYVLKGTIRRDGTYRFGQDYRWGTFWSAAVGWNIDRESFMEDSGFQSLKLRGSYGTQGNQNIAAPDYGSNAMLVRPNLIRDVFLTTTNAYPSYNNASSGFYLNEIGNPVIQWEEIAQANIGLDFKFWKGKFEGNVDVYNKQTTKLFTDIPVSAVNGQYELRGNYGGIRNRGVEVLLRYNMINKQDLKITIFANGSYNKNTITDLKIPLVEGDLINVVGGPVYQWNVVPYLGVNPENGNQMFSDINGNMTEDPQSTDRRRTGKNYFPAYIGGFGFNASYKGFFFDTLFSFQADYYRFDNQEYWSYLFDYAKQGMNISSHLLNAWTPENTNTDIQRIGAPVRDDSSDRFLRDASFIRFKSLTFGYTLPKKFSEKAGFSNLRVFVQGENLYLWRTEYNGYDPEGLGTFPLGSYPNPRTISIGTSIEF